MNEARGRSSLRATGQSWRKAMKRTTLHSALFLLAASAFALPSTATAEETKMLYKCVNDKGVSAIQSKPCPAGSTEAWKRAADAEPKPTAQEVAAAQAREARNREQVRELSAEVAKKVAEQATPTVIGPTPATPSPTPVAERPPVPAVAYDNCQAAQAFASSVQEKTWIGLTDDQTRRIFGWVADQCRVVTKPED
jgi:hypothetical protein